MDREPVLTTATLINCVVCDLLYQAKFSYAHFPELVDLTVVNTGLGILQSNIEFVKNVGSYWDSTQWDVIPRPFLSGQALAYASAMAAWVRDDQDPEWANELPSEVRRPMKKSLKFLFKTDDSFFRKSSADTTLTDRSQQDWMKMASSESLSTQVVAIHHLEFEEHLNRQQETLLLEKLRSEERAILLHAIDATQSSRVVNEPVVGELRMLIAHRDNEVRAKAMCTLTQLGELDETAIDVAVKMLDCDARFVVFAGVFALASLDSVSNHVLPAADRGFIRSLQTCDFEFVGLFTAAFNRWLDDPKTHFEELLEGDSPEYLEIALEALQNVREQFAELRSAS